MIVPSIDLQGGRAVQLRGGKELVIDAGDPRPIAERFRVAGEIAVVDLDGATGEGSNAELMRELCSIADCRVGGGIRDVRTAIDWLNAGATKVVLGTAARPEVLRELPRERTIAALDAVHGEVVVKGWRESTGRTVLDRIDELREHVGGFLVTFVEREGRMAGIDASAVEEIVSRAGDVRVTIAGGVRNAEDVRLLDRLGCDAQVGMAIYNGSMDLGDAICAPMRSDRTDGLWATVVCDERGVALGLCYSNAESVRAAVEQRRGVYWSRSRGGLWVKGETSGDVQELVRIDLDCDRDAIRFTVRQAGRGFCHNGTRTCWGEDGGVGRLARTIVARAGEAPPGSYTRRLLEDRELLRSKLLEEANELLDASTPAEAAWEAADVLYFALVAAGARGAGLAEIERELERRARRVTRRGGDAKGNVELTPGTEG
ncbi:MAG: phosphoribosyl-ATP diphosphatase [Phycisphaerales bacterium]|nr:MAG: phosphoribosyl-ATP diphosphatase [Phycisphaerales bacterium]